MYADRRPPQTPPCATCRVDPMPENADAIRVFLPVRYQFIMGEGGPVDLNHLAIEAAMRREGVGTKTCFDKACSLGFWWINKLRERDKE